MNPTQLLNLPNTTTLHEIKPSLVELVKQRDQLLGALKGLLATEKAAAYESRNIDDATRHEASRRKAKQAIADCEKEVV